MTKRKTKKTIDQFQEEHVEKLERENKELKATNRRVLKSLENAKHKKQDLVNAVYQAVKDNLSLIEIPKVKVPPEIVTGKLFC